MKNTLDYNLVPNFYMHCMNATCKQKEKCLRYAVTQALPRNVLNVRMMNPTLYPELADNCKYFSGSYKQTYATGMSRLLNNVPLAKAKLIKEKLKINWGVNKYYRSSRKEQYLSSTDQKYVKELFIKYSIDEEPVFDIYEEKFEWH